MICSMCADKGRIVPHLPLFFVQNLYLCKCCWFEFAFGSPSNRRTLDCPDALRAYYASPKYEEDVWRDRLKQLIGTPG